MLLWYLPYFLYSLIIWHLFTLGKLKVNSYIQAWILCCLKLNFLLKYFVPTALCGCELCGVLVSVVRFIVRSAFLPFCIFFGELLQWMWVSISLWLLAPKILPIYFPSGIITTSIGKHLPFVQRCEIFIKQTKCFPRVAAEIA